MSPIVDEWQLTVSLDDTFRTPLSIKHKFKIKGETHAVAATLERLAAAGTIERAERDTGGIHRTPGRAGTAPFAVHLYRRKQFSQAG